MFLFTIKQVNQPAFGRVNFARLLEEGFASRQRAERGWCRRRHAERADCAHVKRRVALFLTPRGTCKVEAQLSKFLRKILLA